MTRHPFARLLLLTFALLAGTSVGAQDQQSESVVVTQVFGAGGESPGYRVRFDVRGAGVLSVDLLDHDAPRARGDEAPEPYRLVREELVDPDDPMQGRYAWLLLAQAAPAPPFDGVQGGLDTAVWQVVEQREDAIKFRIEGASGYAIEKLYRYDGEGRRDLRLEISIDGGREAIPGAPDALRFELGGIALAAPASDYVLGQNPSMAIGMTIGPEGDRVLEVARADGKPNVETPILARAGGGAVVEYAGNTNRFFAALLYAADAESVPTIERADMFKVPTRAQGDTAAFTVPHARYGISVPMPAAGARSTVSYRLFLGPKSFHVFDERPEYERFDPVLEEALGSPCFCTIPGARTMARFLLWLLNILQSVVVNWGIAIVCLTILVRGSLVPLNFRMQKSMRAYGAKMAKLKPKLDAIQKRYANEPEVLRAKMVEFQREHKLIPPLGGCLPMLVTIPVFFGLFTALRVSYDLRQEPFLLWVDDLSRPDQLFEIGLSFLPWFNLLPILMVGMWLWLQAGTPLPTDPQQRSVMKIMRYMPLVFGIMLYNYASGLMVYMITSSSFALVEQRVTRRLLGPVDPNAAGIGTTPML